MPRLHRAVGRSGHSIHKIDSDQSTDWVAKVGEKIKPQPNGCWMFDGPTNAGGYGVAFDGHREVLAHRFVYMTLVETGIPNGHDLHHECHTKTCVNPKHLTPMTRSEHTSHHASLRAAAAA